MCYRIFLSQNNFSHKMEKKSPEKKVTEGTSNFIGHGCQIDYEIMRLKYFRK